MFLFEGIIYIVFFSFVVANNSKCNDNELLLNAMIPMIMNSQTSNISESIIRLDVLSMYQHVLLEYYVECNYTQAFTCNESHDNLDLLNENNIAYRRFDWMNNLQIIINDLLKTIMKLDYNYCIPSEDSSSETCKYIRYDLLFKSHNIKIKSQMHGLSMRKVINDISIFGSFIYDLVMYYIDCIPTSTVFSCRRNSQTLNSTEWRTINESNSTIGKLDIIRYNILRTIHTFEYNNLCENS